MKDKKETKGLDVKTFLFYMMIVVVIVLSIWVYFKISDESFKCLSSPVSYGISKMNSSNGMPITCTCTFPGASQTLKFTKDNVSVLNFQGGYNG
jgi:hypothetical protein